MCDLLWFNFSLCTTIWPKIRVAIDLLLSFANIHLTKIYDLLSFILSLCTTIRPKIRVAIELFLSFFFYFFHLQTTIRQKYMIFFRLFFLCARAFRQKLGSTLIYFFYFYTAIRLKLGRALSYSLVYTFLNCANIFVCYIHGSTVLIFRTLYFWQYCLYIPFSIFISVLLLYFVYYIHGSASLFMATWSLSLKHKICSLCLYVDMLLVLVVILKYF